MKLLIYETALLVALVVVVLYAMNTKHELHDCENRLYKHLVKGEK